MALRLGTKPAKDRNLEGSRWLYLRGPESMEGDRIFWGGSGFFFWAFGATLFWGFRSNPKETVPGLTGESFTGVARPTISGEGVFVDWFTTHRLPLASIETAKP